MEIIVGKQGSQSFPITDGRVSRKHVKLTVLDDGNVQVEDLGSSNGTFINGVRIIKKVVDRNAVVRLGASYTFSIKDVLPNVATPPSPPKGPKVAPPPAEFSITHLKKVWEEYDEGLMVLNNKSRKIGLITRMSSIFTIGGGVLGGALRTLEGMEAVSNVSLVASGIGLLIMIYSIIQSASFDYAKAKKKLDEELEENYVCPNPSCRHFLGLKKFSILRQDKQCPYCRSKYIC